MKTKSDSLYHVIFARALVILRRRIQYVTPLSLMLVAMLLTGYSTVANARRDSIQEASSEVEDSVTEDDSDPEYLERRGEFLDRLFGTVPGGVSPSAYASAVIAARALPLSPLLQDRRFIAAELPDVMPRWTFPVLTPICNDWGHGGDPCTTPLPPNSPCGASARIDAIAVDPTNADIVYVGTEGGLSKSTDGGQTWSYLSADLPSQSIRSIVIDPIAPNIVYAGTGTKERFGVGMYRSVDSGATWTVLGAAEFTGGRVVKIAIDPASAGSQTSTTLYASITRPAVHTHGVWKSIDSGSHWSQIRSATGAGSGFTTYDIIIDPAKTPSTVYVTAPDGVFKKGRFADWFRIHDIPDGDATSSLALAQSVLYLAFKASDGSTAIAKSTDQGSSWTPLVAPCVNSFCARLCTFGVNPAHANWIFVGGGGDLVYSLDAGNTWIRSHHVHVDMRSMAFCKTDSKRNYLGTDGGIYRADYEGGTEITWYSKNEHLAGVLMQGVSLSGDGRMVAGTQDNGTQLYAGNNPPWSMVYGGDGFKPQIDQTNSGKLYYVYYTNSAGIGPSSRAPYRVVNGVQTNVTPRGAYGECSSFFPAMFVAPADSSRVIMGFRNVWRSTDSGDSWTRIGGTACPSPAPDPCSLVCGIEPGPTHGTVNGVCEAPNNTDVIYAFFGGRVFVTSDANQGDGAHWAACMSGLPGLIYAVTVNPTDAQTAYFASDHGVYKTTDMGMTYTQVAIPDLGYRDVVIDPANVQHVFAASYAGVFSSTDGGLTWGNMSVGIPAGMIVNGLSVNAASRTLAASTYGRGVYMFDLDELPRPSPTPRPSSTPRPSPTPRPKADFQGTKGQRLDLGSGFRYDQRREIRITPTLPRSMSREIRFDCQQRSTKIRATCVIGSFEKIQTFRVVPRGISYRTPVKT